MCIFRLSARMSAFCFALSDAFFELRWLLREQYTETEATAINRQRHPTDHHLVQVLDVLFSHSCRRLCQNVLGSKEGACRGVIVCNPLMTLSVLEVLAVNHPYWRGITSLPMAGSHPTKESRTIVTVGSVVEVPSAKPDAFRTYQTISREHTRTVWIWHRSCQS